MIPKIKNRVQNLANPIMPKAHLNVPLLYENSITSNITNNDKMILEHWQSLSDDTNIAFDEALELMARVYEDEKAPISRISSYTNIFTEAIIPKVRNAIQMQRSIKRRLTGVKTKISTKINNAIERIKIAHTQNKAVPAAARTQQTQNEAKLNSINKIEKAIEECVVIDRVINNHAKLNKRFSINRFVKESVFIPSQVKDNVLEFCKLIDTYNMPPEAKFSVVIENALYAYECNHIQYKKSDILEAATDYFLMNYDNINNKLKNIMENSLLYNKEDMTNIDLNHEEAEFNLFSEATPDGYRAIGDTKKKLDSIAKTGKEVAKALIKEFKLSPDKTPKSFKDLITKIFTKSDRQVIDETPNILGMIVSFFVIVAGFSMGAVIGILTTLTMCILDLHLSRKEIDRQIAAYEKNLALVRSKIDKKDGETKTRLEEYAKQLEKDIEKLKSYRDDLKSEEEQNAEDDFEVTDESTIDLISKLTITEAAIDTVMKSEYDFISNIDNKANNLSIADIDTLTEVSTKYNDAINPEDLCRIFKEQRVETLKSSNINRYIRSSCLSENIPVLENFNNSLDESKEWSFDDSLKYFSDRIIALESVMEYLESINNISHKPLLEMNFTNSINMVIDRVKKAAENLSEKEKILSRTLDTSLDKFSDGIKNSLRSENREAVIKGNILPPFSRIMKIAITSGLAWVIHPALSLIPIIGAYALSKDLRREEREIVLDELDVELEMCNKYIRIAEDKNDMKGLRNLLMIKKKLESQRNRLRYKMQTAYNEPVKPHGDED